MNHFKTGNIVMASLAIARVLGTTVHVHGFEWGWGVGVADGTCLTKNRREMMQN